jgi:hypothetical protein
MRQHQDRAALATAVRPCQHCQRDRAQDTTSVTAASRVGGLVIPGGPKATFDRMRALEAKLTIYRNDSEITHVNSSGRMRSVSGAHPDRRQPDNLDSKVRTAIRDG